MRRIKRSFFTEESSPSHNCWGSNWSRNSKHFTNKRKKKQETWIERALSVSKRKALSMTTVLNYKMNYILNLTHHVWKHPPVPGSSIAKYFTFPYLVHIHSTPKLNIKLKDNDCNIYSSMSPLLNDFSPGGTSVIVYVAFLSCMNTRQCTCLCRNLNKRVYTHTCGGLSTTPCVILRSKSLRYYPSLTWNWLIRLDLMASKSQGSSCLCVPSVTGMMNAMSPRLDDLTWVLGMILTSSEQPFTDLAFLPYPYCTKEPPNFFYLILEII